MATDEDLTSRFRSLINPELFGLISQFEAALSRTQVERWKDPSIGRGRYIRAAIPTWDPKFNLGEIANRVGLIPQSSTIAINPLEYNRDTKDFDDPTAEIFLERRIKGRGDGRIPLLQVSSKVIYDRELPDTEKDRLLQGGFEGVALYANKLYEDIIQTIKDSEELSKQRELFPLGEPPKD